jgi:hypothetical protein
MVIWGTFSLVDGYCTQAAQGTIPAFFSSFIVHKLELGLWSCTEFSALQNIFHEADTNFLI